MGGFVRDRPIPYLEGEALASHHWIYLIEELRPLISSRLLPGFALILLLEYHSLPEHIGHP